MNVAGELPSSLEGQHWRALSVVSDGASFSFPNNNKFRVGILAYAIGKMNGTGGRRGWQW
jgi:hypothetical protein